MAKLRTMLALCLAGGLASLSLWTIACNPGGAGSAGGGGGTTTPPATSQDTLINFDNDPNSARAATAKTSDGSELAIYGEKDSAGALQKTSQLDIVLDGTTDTTSVELDDAEQPVRIEAGDGSAATFTYDQDAGTVQVEVVDATGNSAVNEAVQASGTDASNPSGRPDPSVALQGAPLALCTRLNRLRSTLDTFFECAGGEDDAFCGGRFEGVARAIRELCQNQPVERDFSSNLGADPRRIPLGIRPHVTTRPGADGSTTAILVATVFGGVRPYQSINWSQLDGPADAPLENLPGGTAVADLLASGNYVFRAEVMDSGDHQASADIDVETEALLSIRILADSDRVDVGQVVEFNAEIDPPLGDTPHVLHWRFGDGNSNTGPSVTHAFTEEGKFVVTVLLTTRDGRRGTDSKVIKVGPADSCEGECQANAEQQFFDCLASGVPENECAVQVRDFVMSCLHDDCGLNIDCGQHCTNLADQALQECHDQGGTDEECDVLARAFQERCIHDLCDQTPDCERRCTDGADRAREECIAGGGDEADCTSQADLFLSVCLDQDCASDRQCPDRCREHADRAFQECRDHGGSEEECAVRSRRFLERCVQEQCGGSQDDCGQLCQNEAERVFQACRADGGTEEACAGRTRDFVEHCLRNECDRPGDCEGHCRDQAEREFRDCIVNGGSEEECAARTREFVDQCLREQCDRQLDCDVLCRDQAEPAFGDCLDQGGNEEDCAIQVSGLVERCLREECDRPVVCEDHCHKQAEPVFNECIARGGTEEECNGLVDRFVERCLNEQCGGPTDCGERCLIQGDRMFRECRDAGGSEEECGTRVQDFVEQCKQEQCGEIGNCEEQCRAESEREFRLCLELGGGIDDCAARARDFGATCLRDRCDRPMDCEQTCLEEGTRTFRECHDRGDPEAECRRQARQFTEDCVREQCGPPIPCEDRCGELGQQTFHKCLERGGSERNCGILQDAVITRCLNEQCGQDIPCEDQCHERGGTALDECLATGRGEDECGAEADAVVEACLRDECGVSDKSCGGITGLGCDPGAYCVLPDGTCDSADLLGECRPMPDGCPDVFDPVCGCDGVTYGNECEAAASGVNLDHAGECGAVSECGGISGIGCDVGAYCVLPDGTCDSTDLLGECVLMPDICTDIFDPVCGCDGVTYDNECNAAMAGVNIDHAGDCGAVTGCGGLSGIGCSVGEYCVLPDGTCDSADLTGECMAMPDICTDVVDPVCGCDGVTYDSECNAAMAGVNIDHVGDCGAVTGCGGLLGIGCSVGEYCVLPDGTCDSADLTGECMAMPDICTDVVDPVCGCDGVTYDSECNAAMVGVNIDHVGECVVVP